LKFTPDIRRKGVDDFGIFFCVLKPEETIILVVIVFAWIFLCENEAILNSIVDGVINLFTPRTEINEGPRPTG
jgi:hypothetical protein